MDAGFKDILRRELEFPTNQAETTGQLSDREEKLIQNFGSFIRFNLVKHKKGMILRGSSFAALGQYLCEKSSISYHSFKSVAALAPEAAKKYFTAKTFLMFPRDDNQHIESEAFVRYVERSIDIENTIWDLMEFAPSNTDPFITYITEQEIESFIYRLIPTIDIDASMHESFYEYYIYTSSQKFLFFLDSRKNNCLSVKKVAHSKVMEELLNLCRLSTGYTEENSKEYDKKIRTNWFRVNNALRIYSLFLDLDKDQNGMLSIDEMLSFVGLAKDQVNFTNTALERLYSENICYQPYELDYKGFVKLILALENIETTESLKYFWNILDYDHSGFLTEIKIKFFYTDIYNSLIHNNYEAPSVDHVITEIFDMVSCSDTLKGMNFNQFSTSKQGHTIVKMLLDINGFWRYDNRESLLNDEDEDDEEEMEQYVEPEMQIQVEEELQHQEEFYNQFQSKLQQKSDIGSFRVSLDEVYDDEFEQLSNDGSPEKR